MPTTLSTPRLSSPKLSEVARYLVIPDGIVTSTWPKVERRLNSAGVEFDPWQQGFASAALGCRKDGKYAATVGGVVASIPRQVGKTFTVGHLLIGLAAEFAGLRIIWTSHHARTTTNTFRSLQGMLARPKMAPLIAPNGVRVANGEQEIRFRNGSILMFGAREHGFGRGMDAIDVEVFDEAQILSLKALEDMVPATNQARHVHGALVFFIGTPPRPGDDGEAFSAKRNAAIDGQTSDQMYVELSADPDAKSDDRSEWPAMNPSYPVRTPLESMLRMRANIPDEGSWRREAMGIWSTVDEESVIDMDRWAELEDLEESRPDPVAFGFAVSPDRKWASIVMAGTRSDGARQLQVVQTGRGTDWIVPRLVELVAAWNPVGVAISPDDPGGSLIAELAGLRRFPLVRVSQRDQAQAAGMVLDGISDGTLFHAGQPVLTISAGAARKKRTGETWIWAPPADGGTDIAPLKAATGALFALAKKPARKKSTTERRATIL